MEMRQRMVFDRIWVGVSRKTGSARTDLNYIVALHQVLNEINKTKRLLFPLYNSLPSPTISYR